ncbi:MAG: FAD-dependent oxidoreductase [Clostridiaceae bacterium]|nr:FAD-dependent oxidoreductase [Clostridiaceae bacterium]
MGKDKKRIAIVGGGYGGVHAARLLGKAARKRKDISVLLVDKKPYHTLMTELHEVAGNRAEAESVQIDLREIFGESGVRVETEEIKSIDFKSQKLQAASESYPYDYLIIDTGAEPAFFGTPGVKENGFTLWSYEDAIRIREHIKGMFDKAKAEKDQVKRRAMLTFVVAGAGFTGIETMGEFLEWRRELCREYEIDGRDVSLMVVEAMGSILPILNEGLIKKSERYMSRHGVEIITSAPITEVKRESIILKDGREIPTRTLIWTCGVQGSDFAAKTELTHGGRGRIQVNEYMQSVEYQNVFAIGDNAFYEETDDKGGKKPMPQIVETALQTADTAVHNILATIDNRNKKPFKSNYHGFMVSIGGRYAVANIGGRSLDGFVAMALKHLVNIHYQYGVGGLARIWDYVMHEFILVREGRSILGGHLSARTPILWLAILRVYLGIIWLIEGVKKINEGWLNPGKSFITAMPKPGDVPLKSTDAVTNATQVTQYYPEPLLKEPPRVFQWIMETFIEPNAYLFQVLIVLMEVAVGLALIAGLFTILASLGSIFLCFNFILSAMAGTEIFWHIFAGIAMFGGAGRAFGLDYYVIPWLKHRWKRVGFARRTHLYIR